LLKITGGTNTAGTNEPTYMPPAQSGPVARTAY